MEKIWEKDFGYSFFKPYIVWATRTLFSKVNVKGLEHLPDPGKTAVIVTANHCNTLMDALVILQSSKDTFAYVARADIFKKPFIAHLLGNMRILPIYRRRDGEDSREKNEAIFDNVVEAINHGVMLSIHPEGTHRARRSLMAFKTGAVRIAQQSAVTHPDKPVCIVPAGLNYDDLFNIMRPVTLTFGEPIAITGDEDVHEMTETLRERVSELFPCFPDDENLAAAENAYEESIRPKSSICDHFLALLLLPLMAVSGFLCSPMLILTAILKPKLKDHAWYNTMRYVVKLFLTPFTVIGAAIAGFINLKWYLAVALILCTVYAHPAFYWILAFLRTRIFKK